MDPFPSHSISSKLNREYLNIIHKVDIRCTRHHHNKLQPRSPTAGTECNIRVHAHRRPNIPAIVTLGWTRRATGTCPTKDPSACHPSASNRPNNLT